MLSKKYGVAVATHRGKVHDYLGMIFDFSPKEKVMVTMMEYIKNIIKDFPEEIAGAKTSPAADHLFTVRDPSLAKVLPEEQAMAFHRTTASVPECKGAVGHLAHHCFSDHASKVPGQGRLGQGQEGAELSEGYSAHASHPVGRLSDALTVVGGRSVRCTC
jgi:hypothetical protein